jgi:alpha-tubulin suppressor-like RCC1 family protein
LKHKYHNILSIKEAIQILQKEIESSTEEKIKTIEEFIERINVDISKRNKQYEEESKKLKGDYMKDLDNLGDSQLNLKENLNMLKELKVNLKSSNIFNLLKIKNEINFGETYSFGFNYGGQLGLGNTTDQSTPQMIPFFKTEKIKNVSCGDHHTIITTGN